MTIRYMGESADEGGQRVDPDYFKRRTARVHREERRRQLNSVLRPGDIVTWDFTGELQWQVEAVNASERFAVITTLLFTRPASWQARFENIELVSPACRQRRRHSHRLPA